MSAKFSYIENPSSAELDELGNFLKSEIFEEFDASSFKRELQFHKQVVCHLARDTSGRLIGVKVAYAKDPSQLYSWLGGVSARHRGAGIGKSLMQQQYDWCRKNNFKAITLKTMNRWKTMLLMSISFGFQIVGTHLSENGELKIMLSKPVE